MFIPKENIKEISTTEHPGVAAIWQAGKGKDIKGILKEPIRTDEYAMATWLKQCGVSRKLKCYP
jgi:hypothetical protein